MTTRGAMKTAIKREMDRVGDSSLDTDIEEAVTEACNYYSRKKFTFNQEREVSFNTVAGQYRYTSTDDARIPKILAIDMVYVTDNGTTYELERCSAAEIDIMANDTSAISDRPWSYARFDNSLWIYPKPDAAYAVRVICRLRYDAPATDNEADNVWMTQAYELIKCRAKAYIAHHRTRNEALRNDMRAAEQDNYNALVGHLRETSGENRAEAYYL